MRQAFIDIQVSEYIKTPPLVPSGLCFLSNMIMLLHIPKALAIGAASRKVWGRLQYRSPLFLISKVLYMVVRSNQFP